ncbi:hypothetical protein AKJ57_03640 [candidate division MSBL1 archaeon SCGC-AAA259A05]|uniref:Uncharacterized protein n=1 Tax=candidate division MSBL1 archaeon SCGC-AAA259A05 TaxID=1698259 RepID=A0A133U9B3_9EURY|nr:hypothetical protein AKJ57_03640 [candidate division MSBL1 archaeon SCGC-AAA259A05]
MKDTPEKSNRQIARMLGVHHDTVRKHREDLEESGQIDHFSKREDPRTGDLSQPAEKPKKKSPRKCLLANDMWVE